MFLAPISVYPDIVCNIGYISEPISAKNPISEWQLTGKMEYRARYRRKNADIGSNFHDIGVARNGYAPICIRYRTRYSQYRVRYRRQEHDIVTLVADIGIIGLCLISVPISGQPVSDPISGPISDTISDPLSDTCSDNFSFRQVLLPRTNFESS